MKHFEERWWQLWDDYWFELRPPESLAIFRILLGLFFLVYWLLRAPHVSFLFSTDGVYFPFFDPPAAFSEVGSARDLLGWLLTPIPLWATWTLYTTLIVSLVLFTVGWWTRFAAIAYFLLYVYFYHLQLYRLDASYDRLFLQTALLICVSRCDEIFSLRALWRRRKGLPLAETIPFWPARLIGLQMMLVYFGTGFHKVFSPAWAGGEILYYSFIGLWASDLAFGIAQLGLPMAVYGVMVYGTIAFELSAPIGLHVRRFQPWYFVAGVFFHLSIALTLQIWQFMAMPAAYILFLDPAWVRQFCRKFASRPDAHGHVVHDILL